MKEWGGEGEIPEEYGGWGAVVDSLFMKSLMEVFFQGICGDGEKITKENGKSKRRLTS